MSRAVAFLCVTFLALGILWLLWPRGWDHEGLTLAPQRATLEGGQTLELQVVNREPTIVALKFRLRFDERVVAVTAAAPAYPGIFDGGDAINLPARRQAGRIDIPATAVTGGRVFTAAAPVYRFTLQGIAPGTAVVAVEDVTLIDVGFTPRSIPGATAEITVHNPARR